MLTRHLPSCACWKSHYLIAASALQKNFPELSSNHTHLRKQGVMIGRAVSIMERNKVMGQWQEEMGEVGW